MEKRTLTTVNITGGAEVYYEGNLVAECLNGSIHGTPELRAEVDRARCLENLAHILKAAVRDLETKQLPDEGKKPAEKRQDMAAGLFDGLQLRTEPYPIAHMGMPPIRPHGSNSYHYGYQMGEALARCLKLIDDRERKISEARSTR